MRYQSLPRFRQWTASAFAAFATLLSVGACRSNPVLGITMDLTEMGSGYQASGDHWVQFGAFAKSNCDPFGKRLALGGLPAVGAVRGLSWKLGSPTTTVGDLPKSDYALVAVIKNRDCVVEGFGCTFVKEAMVGSDAATKIKIGKIAGGGGCEAQQCCSYGRCVESPATKGCDGSAKGAEPEGGDPAPGQGQGLVAPTEADETIGLQIETL
jgi:hypothetical protein